MQLLQYFVAFLVFFAGFVIMDCNTNGAFKHNELMRFLSALLFILSCVIACL